MKSRTSFSLSYAENMARKNNYYSSDEKIWKVAKMASFFTFFKGYSESKIVK